MRRLILFAFLFLLVLVVIPAHAAVEPPTLVQYASSTSAGFTHVTNITYQTGDAVLVFATDGNAVITSVTDGGGSSFTSATTGAYAGYWQTSYTLSALASGTVTVATSVNEDVTVVVSVYRGVSSIGAIVQPVAGTNTTIAVSQAISAGSKLVGMLGDPYNAAGVTTVIGDVSGKTVHGDLRTSAGDANTYGLVALVDYDGSLTSGSSPTLQLTQSLAGGWIAMAIELKGVTPSYPLYNDFYVIGDIIDSDCLTHAAVLNSSAGLTFTGSKGTFPCIPQNGGSSVPQTYAMGHASTRFSFTYGTIEASIKFAGYGVHNQLWMLGVPSRPWANDGSAVTPSEIDVAEIGVNDVYTAVRNAYANPTFSPPYGNIQDNTTSFDPTAGFHIYKLVWAPGSLTWYIDGVQTYQQTSNVPNSPMYVLFGGYMGEYAINDSLLPQVMTIKYLNITDASTNPVSNTGNVNIIPAYGSSNAFWFGLP
jgi:hypothetical protein